MRGLKQSLTALLLVLMCIGSASVWAETKGLDPIKLLKKMVQATKSTSFMGDFVYTHEGKLETMRVFYGVDENGTRERLEALNGPPREILKINGEVDCFFPQSASIRYDRRLKNPVESFSPETIDHLEQSYTIRALGKDRIAGRPAYRVGIVPKFPDRYGFWIWLDVETGLLLKMSMTDKRRQPLEQFMFVDITIVDEVPATLFISEGSNQRDQNTQNQVQALNQNEPPAENPVPTLDVSHDEAQLKETGEVSTSDWNVRNLPEGFRLQHHQRQARENAPQKQFEHMLFTDGLATISVYLEPLGDDKAYLGRSQIGAVSAFGRVVAGHQVMVVGEVPVETVVYVGKSIQFLKDSSSKKKSAD